MGPYCSATYKCKSVWLFPVVILSLNVNIVSNLPIVWTGPKESLCNSSYAHFLSSLSNNTLSLLFIYLSISQPWTQMSQPIVAAFYGTVAACVVLLVILIGCCGLWKSAKRYVSICHEFDHCPSIVVAFLPL